MTMLSRIYSIIFSAIIITTCLLTVACNEKGDKTSKTEKIKRTETIFDTSTAAPEVAAETKTDRDTLIEVMDEAHILLNGKLKRYLSVNEFIEVLGKPDSTKLLSDEEPCTTIFQEADGSVDPEAKYLYKNGSRFENSRDKVAIDEVHFANGDFILFGKFKLSKHTTVNDLKKLFPNAAKHIDDIDVAGEGKLKVMQLREDKDNISDGHIKLFIKDGRLYKLHWWFPC